MGKTISLKITGREEELVDQLRNKGVSPSMLLREALRKYVRSENENNMAKGYKQVDQVDQIYQEKVDQGIQKGYKEVNQVDEIDTLFMEKGYKQVDQVDQIYQEKVDQGIQKGYKEVNQVDLDEKDYLRLYINSLTSRITQLDNEIQEWKNRYAFEGQQWKDSYAALQLEYQAQTKDMLKRLDDKFDRLLFYFDESHKPSLQVMNVGSHETVSENGLGEKKKEGNSKKGPGFPMIRM